MATSMIDSEIAALRKSCRLRNLSVNGAREELIYRICSDFDSRSKYGQRQLGGQADNGTSMGTSQSFECEFVMFQSGPFLFVRGC